MWKASYPSLALCSRILMSFTMNKQYKNLVFTTHALERLKERSLSQDTVYQAVNRPDFQKDIGDTKTKFFKTIRTRKVQVIGTYLSKEKKWLVVSVWVRGEEDPVPIVWRILVSPFKILCWLLKKIFSS